MSKRKCAMSENWYKILYVNIILNVQIPVYLHDATVFFNGSTHHFSSICLKVFDMLLFFCNKCVFFYQLDEGWVVSWGKAPYRIQEE